MASLRTGNKQWVAVIGGVVGACVVVGVAGLVATKIYSKKRGGPSS